MHVRARGGGYWGHGQDDDDDDWGDEEGDEDYEQWDLAPHHGAGTVADMAAKY